MIMLLREGHTTRGARDGHSGVQNATTAAREGEGVTEEKKKFCADDISHRPEARVRGRGGGESMMTVSSHQAFCLPPRAVGRRDSAGGRQRITVMGCLASAPQRTS